MAALALSAGLNNCSFPTYGVPNAAAGSGAAGAGGFGVAGMNASGTGGVGGSGVGGSDVGGAGIGGIGGRYTAGAGGAVAGAGGEPCQYPSPVIFPAHCFDQKAGEEESGLDCGGSECAPCSGDQTCTRAADCLSERCSSDGRCVPIISLTYSAVEVGATTPMPKFQLSIIYLDTAVTSLDELTIRYYYNHKNVNEPVLGLDSQATIDPGNSQVDIGSFVTTSVHRFPLGPVDAKGLTTDSYLEIGFNDSRTVTPGTKLTVNQDFVAGNAARLFDQNGHYSFSRVSGANTAITVYRAGRRIWGVEPPMVLLPECAFSGGVNINGPALKVSGESLSAEKDVAFTFDGCTTYSNSDTLLPATDKATSTLLGTGRGMDASESMVWPVPNGKYWAYAWLRSASGGDDGTLSFGDSSADPFINNMTGGARWALVGPYAIDVANKSLQLTVDGGIHLAGVKLYAAAR